MARNVGTSADWQQIPKRSHTWGRKVNDQLVKYGVLLQGSVKSRTDTVPASGASGDIYIHPTNKRIYAWVEAWNDGDGVIPAEWYIIQPTTGLVMHVQDVDKWYVYTQLADWQLLWDPSKSHRAIQREFAFYHPYLIRPSAKIFGYVATKEFAIAAGAPGSGSHCEIAPVGGSVVYSIRKGNAQIGTITFADGSTDGVIDFPNMQVILPAIQENMYEVANILQVVSPANIRSMQGLHVTIQGIIRSID